MTTTKKRESLLLTLEEWAELERAAKETGSYYYHGRPSWRVMVARVARGELTVREKAKGTKE